ncbi:MAG: YajQ family cyclic di-GMP-binding protein [Bacteroidia bacterium]|jgi:hypothetical protein
MPSFDIVCKTDMQLIDNAINISKKELLNRYDLKNEDCSIELDRKGKQLQLSAKQEMALQSMIDIILSKFSKQHLDVRLLDISKTPRPSGKLVLQDVPIKEGIDKETAKKIVQFIKETKLKVQAAINEDQLRVTAKQIDDLQQVIAAVRAKDFELPLQFENMRS